jgi:hypothetical protein
MSPRVHGGRRAARRSEMHALAGRFDASGLTQAEFCRLHGVPLSTFTYWRRQLHRRGSTESPFVEVEVVGGATGFPIEISLPGGLAARIGAEATEALIRRVIRAAGSPC